jgi:hypothetical protein
MKTALTVLDGFVDKHPNAVQIVKKYVSYQVLKKESGSIRNIVSMAMQGIGPPTQSDADADAATAWFYGNFRLGEEYLQSYDALKVITTEIDIETTPSNLLQLLEKYENAHQHLLKKYTELVKFVAEQRHKKPDYIQ